MASKRFTGGSGKSFFKVSGVLFNSTAIESLMSKKAKKTLTQVGRKIKRRAKRSLKLAKRVRSASQIKDPLIRKSFELRMTQFERGNRTHPPSAPFVPSKPGGIPKIRRRNSPLKRGIFFSYDAQLKSVIVGPAKINGIRGDAPHALEHGGNSSGRRIARRPYMSTALIKSHSTGEIKKAFARNIKI